jgi:hypothetical protein
MASERDGSGPCPTVSSVSCFEQTEADRVITHAQSQPGHRPNENATCGARLERADDAIVGAVLAGQVQGRGRIRRCAGAVRSRRLSRR